MKTFKSKVDVWIVLLMNLSLFLPCIMLINDKSWVGFAIVAVTALSSFYILFSFRYYISDTHLVIKISFFTIANIEIHKIKTIEETNTIISAPAASLDRLYIYYNKYDFAIISPADKADFINTLLSINPDIEVIYKNK
ncbi:MAG: PH domain-containing protein [Cytophagales bacterium]|nr:PH domain-containing protein [Cytophagales bacterium]